MTVRRLKSTAAYEDGEEHEREFELDIPDDPATLEELLYGETGFGRPSDLSAVYEVVSIDGLEPELRFEWGG